MIGVLSLVTIAFAVSLDSFGVGLTYGLRNMKLPWRSLLFIAGCSGTSILIAMLFGSWLLSYLPATIAEAIGGVILLFIGGWAIYQAYKPAETKEKTKEEEWVFKFEIKMLGIVIQILRKPMVADIDNSGTITGREAMLLGIALSLDAFGAGIGASLIGFSPVWMAISVAFMSALFVTLGMKSGRFFSGSLLIKRFAFIPGALLMMIGVFSFT
ncbi:sporulation membrane protein YtaF [Halalkalibacter sp. APA_J-10(15)]|uniref:sporulation membrane protein YtaF n=1 Tax=unclassified Halalkalibacter TaxID=2893063 RepID=UPI001FF37D60|nr:sporulation membrane protein YtaF [Halalkalibacter sp. APA_J-10(15)]MCK0471353.1 sporulation membrane protein YtaF [Halalkalibacter sp. APA_J-10(15)]